MVSSKVESLTHNSLGMSIAGISILISSESQEFVAQIRERYANFIADGMDPSIKIRVESLPSQDVEINAVVADESQPPRVSFNNSKEMWIIAYPGFFGEFNLKNGAGRAVFGLHPAGLNSFLRFVYSLILLKRLGFLVHASSLIKNGRAYIFPGKSGVGKTTIAQLSPEATLLSDDISLVKIIKGDFIAFGTPFWGALAVGGENVFAPISGIYFPIKDRENFLRKLTPQQALEKLLPNVVCFARNNEEFSKQLFNLCSDFVTKKPAYELHFLPDPTFWRCIDAE